MKKYNLLLPIAGEAQRFKNEGYDAPKPLILAKDKHIIDWALDSFKTEDCNIIFVVRAEHIYTFSIDEVLKQKFGEDIQIAVVEERTEGSVCTCLAAKEYIDNDLPLFIYTPDVYYQPQFDPNSVDSSVDGFVLTFKANSPAHSYLAVGKDGYVTKTAEKEVISTNAAVGVYYYKTGKIFIKYAEKMIDLNIRVNNEFYICPMYNLLIQDGLKVIQHQTEKMHVLGTPEELRFFENYVVQSFGEKPIALCCDHSAFELKEECKKLLSSLNISFIDFGTYVDKNCDYNDYVSQAVQAVDKGVCDFILGFCRTGNGINICANKNPNIRGAMIFDEYTAEFSMRHNCANFFSIPSKYVKVPTLNKMFKRMLTSSFDGGRHMTRMYKTLNK